MVDLITNWSEQFEKEITNLDKISKIIEKSLIEIFKDEKVIIAPRVKDLNPNY